MFKNVHRVAKACPRYMLSYIYNDERRSPWMSSLAPVNVKKLHVNCIHLEWAQLARTVRSAPFWSIHNLRLFPPFTFTARSHVGPAAQPLALPYCLSPIVIDCSLACTFPTLEAMLFQKFTVPMYSNYEPKPETPGTYKAWLKISSSCGLPWLAVD